MIWIALIALMGVFIALHVLPFYPAMRGRSAAAVGGEKPYMGLYAVLSLVGLVGAFTLAGRAPPVVFWAPNAVVDWIAFVATFLGFVLVAAAYVGGAGQRFARHPMLAGIALWAGAHVLANGELGHLLVFGALAAYAPAAMVLSDRRDAVRDPEAFARRRETTSLIPFTRLTDGAVPWQGPAAGVGGWLAFLFLHGWLFGASPWPPGLG